MPLEGDELRQRLEPLFQENFSKFGELGAAVSVWQNGKPVLDLHDGFRDARRELPWESDTLVLVWSATKGIGSACLLHLLQENKIGLDRPVSDFWPEFAQNGKSEISLATLLSHRAGLCALDQPADVLEYDAVIRAVEKQRPLWPPGTKHGYHARTFGFLLDEMVRRIARMSLADYWRKNLAEPLALDFWIGLPAELNARTATVYAAKAGKPPQPEKFYRDLKTNGTLQQRTFTSPRGLHAVSAMNNPEIRARQVVSFGGIGSASALAKFYGMLANGGELDGRRFFNADTRRQMENTLASGPDEVFEIPTSFSAGFMKNPAGANHHIFGPSLGAFGHPGAGGSHAFADPEKKIGFAYVMNQMEQTLLPKDKSLRLVEALYQK